MQFAWELVSEANKEIFQLWANDSAVENEMQELLLIKVDFYKLKSPSIFIWK